jgi:hypothetical protein
MLQRVVSQALYSCGVDLVSPLRKLLEKLWQGHPLWAPYVGAVLEGGLLYALAAELPACVLPAHTPLVVPRAFAALLAAQAAGMVGKLQEGLLALEVPPILALLLPLAAFATTEVAMWTAAAFTGVAAVSIGQLVIGYLTAAGKLVATTADSLKPAKEVVPRHKLTVGAAAACLLPAVLHLTPAACPACCAWLLTSCPMLRRCLHAHAWPDA